MKATRLVALICFCLTFACRQSQDWRTISDRAEAAMTSGQFAEAIRLYDQAIALMPEHPSLFTNRGNCRSMSGQLDLALKDYDTAIEIAKRRTGGKEDKRFAYSYYNKAYAYDRRDMHKEAVPLYEKTIQLDPEHPDAKGHLAWILATSFDMTLRNPTQAVMLARLECDATQWKDSDEIDTYAAALAASGDFDAAIKWQLKAIDLAGSKEATAEFTDRLKLYREGQHYVQEIKSEPRGGG